MTLAFENYPLAGATPTSVWSLPITNVKFEPPHDNQQNDCAPSEDWSAWASAQSDQSLRCALSG